MLSNSEKLHLSKFRISKSLFLQAGRSGIEFSKALYELTARNKEPELKSWVR